MKQQEQQLESLVDDRGTIDPIRVQMLFTELPVHQLSKRGSGEIRILRRDPRGGQVTLAWKVEPNLNVGRPGQLAYHLDTWVINRRLDGLPRPAPRLIRIGNLREIARELGHGGDTNTVKRAFEQNASVFIRAKLAYVTRDGREERFEGYFNRYNVFFRGQRLPGDRLAETVYISLNDPYFPIINGPKPRPLDFAYLKSLTPTAQRFYELVSPKMYAAIKNGHPRAWIRYSEFCQLAVQRRYDTRRRMQIQMAAVHKPHLASGYVAEVFYRAVPSLDGVPDWTIHYVPGPRARTEFHAFNPGCPRLSRSTPHSIPPVSSGESQPGPEHKLPQTQSAAFSTARSLASRFAQIRFGASAAGAVTPGQLDRAQRILDALDGVFEAAVLAVEIAATQGRSDKKGFPNHLGGVIEGGFVEKARAIREEEAKRKAARAERTRLESRQDSYEAWCRQRAEERVRELAPEVRSRIVDERLPRYVEAFIHYVRLMNWNDESVRAWAEPRILKQYGREGEPTFDAWSNVHEAEMTGSSGPA